MPKWLYCSLYHHHGLPPLIYHSNFVHFVVQGLYAVQYHPLLTLLNFLFFLAASFQLQDLKLCSVKFLFLLSGQIFVNETFSHTE